MWSQLRSWRRLTAADRRLLLRAALLLHLMALALRLLPFDWVWSYVQRKLGRPRPPQANSTPLERIGWAVTRAARPILHRDSCLPQACTAGLLLARDGYPCAVHMGVRRDGERLAAHAWTTVADVVVVGGPDVSGYQPLPSAGARP